MIIFTKNLYMRNLSSIILILFFASCSPSQRIARILSKHPELIKSDTIWRKDTIVTKEVKKDTSFYFYQPDTVYMTQGKLQVKYYFNHDSTIYLQGKCLADTIYKYYPIQVNPLSLEKHLKWYDKVKVWIMDNILWIILILWILWRLFGAVIKTWLKL